MCIRDRLVRHRGGIPGGEHARHRGLATGIELDFPARRKFHTPLQPFGVGHQADLHENAIQIEPVHRLTHAVLVAQANHLAAVAMHLGAQRGGDNRGIVQARQLALQHRIGAQLGVELDQGDVRHNPREVDRRLHAGIAAADHRDALAFEPVSYTHLDVYKRQLRDQVLSTCGSGVGRTSEFAATSLHTLIQMVAGGLGLTLVPRLAVLAGITQGADVDLRRLEGAGGWRSIALAWRPNSPHAAEYRALAPLIVSAGSGAISNLML